MRPGARITSGLVLLAVLAGFWLLPTPHERDAERQRAEMQVRIDELAWELSVAKGRLADTQSALAAESAIRQSLADQMIALVTEVEGVQAAQYTEIVAAFRDAADVACGPVDTDEPQAVADDEVAWLAAKAAGCNATSLTVMADELAALPMVCGVVPVEAINGNASIDQCVVLYAHTDQVAIAEIPVTDWVGKGITDVLATSVSVSPGDTLDVSGYFQVTNELSETVGVGAHLWAYSAGRAAEPARRIGPATGDNVDRSRHHMPIALQTVYVVPNDWPPGDEMTIVLRADAHSTRAKGNVGVDANGNLIVRITRA